MPACARPDIINERTIYRWCPHCDRWKLLAADNFYRSAKGYGGFQRTCKTCRKAADNRRPHLQYHGYVYLSHIRPWLRALIRRLGWTRAARQLGVTNSMLARWLNGSQQKIQKRYVSLILKTCITCEVNSPDFAFAARL